MENISQTILKDFRVLEVGQGTASGWCGRMLLDFGARVYRLNDKSLEELKDKGVCVEETHINKNLKEWLNYDKKEQENIEYSNFDLILIAETIHGFKLSDSDNSIVVDLSWFGEKGIYSNWKGSDITIQALAGTIYPVGPKEETPIFTGETEASIIGGTNAFIASVVAILENRINKKTNVSILESNMILGELQSSDSIRFGKPNSREGINRFFPTCPLGIYKCKTGWLGTTVITLPQWKSFCELLDLQDLFYQHDLNSIQKRSENIDFLEDLIKERLRLKGAKEWAKLGREKRIPMVEVPNPTALQSHQVFNKREALSRYLINSKEIRAPKTPICQFYSDDLSARTSDTNNARKIFILDFSMGWAGPLATRILSDVGAEVVKVEAGTYPDWWRATNFSQEAIDKKQYEESRRFAALNRGKKSISIDLKTDEGLKVARQLVAQADIVIENQADGVMEKLGLGQNELRKVNSNLTLISLTAFGSGNELSETRAYGSTLEHASGTPFFRGKPNWPPLMAHIAYGDPIGGIYGAAALLLSILHRQKNDGFMFVNISLTECLLPFAANGLLNYSPSLNHDIDRIGNRHTVKCPHGVFYSKNSDQYVALSVENDTSWLNLCRLIDNKRIEKFKNMGVDQRKNFEQDIEKLISEWMFEMSSTSLIGKLQEAGVSAAPVISPEKCLDDKYLNEANFYYDTLRPFIGVQKQVGLPFNDKEGKRYQYQGDAPFLGVDTHKILKEKLGYSEKEVEKLFENDISTLSPIAK